MSEINETLLNNIYIEDISKELFNEYAVTIPEPQYLGCKQKHLPWIFSYIPNDIQTIFDGFAGSQCFGFEAKKRGYSVISNDFMNFSHQIGLSLIENSKDLLTRNDLTLLLAVNNKKKNLMERLFKNIFFTERDCVFLDNFRANVDLLSSNYKKALALTIMNRAMTRKTTMGHFAHLQALNYANDPERVKRNPNIAKGIDVVFLSLVKEYNNYEESILKKIKGINYAK